MEDDAVERLEVLPLNVEAIEAGMAALKAHWKSRVLALPYPLGAGPDVVLPAFSNEQAQGVYDDVRALRLLNYLRRPEDDLIRAPPPLIEDFSRLKTDPRHGNVLESVLTELGFTFQERETVKGLPPEVVAVIVEDGLVLRAVELCLSNGRRLDELDDDLIESTIEREYQLADSVVPGLEQQFREKCQQVYQAVMGAVRLADGYVETYSVDAIEKGVGAVPPRATFQSQEAFTHYLNELQGKKISQGLCEMAPTALRELAGKRQYELHGAVDAFDHSLKMARELRVDHLNTGLAELVRVAGLFHDIGKSVNPLNVNHAFYSDYLVEPILARMDYGPSEEVSIRMLIKHHDSFGLLMKGELDLRRMVLDLTPPVQSDFSLEDMLEAAYELNRADIASMPWTRITESAKRYVAPKEEVLTTLDERRLEALEMCRQLGRECEDLDRIIIEPVGDSESTRDTRFDLAVRACLGQGDIELPSATDELIALLVRRVAEQYPDLISGDVSYANRISNLGRLLRNAVSREYHAAIDEVMADSRLVIADALLSQEQRWLGSSPKVWLRKQDVVAARELLRRDWSDVVAPHLHGSSSFAMIGFAREEGLLPSSEIAEEMRVIGELALGVHTERIIPSPGGVSRRCVSLTGDVAVAQAYSRLNQAGGGFNLHPLYVAEKACHSAGAITGELETIGREILALEGGLVETSLARYRQIGGRLSQLADHREDAEQLHNHLWAMEFSLNKLKYIAQLGALEQRALLNSTPVIFGFSEDVPIDSKYQPKAPNWLSEVRVKGRVKQEYLSHLYADSRDLERYRAQFPWTRVTPIQALAIYVSLITGGRSDADAAQIYGNLCWRPVRQITPKLKKEKGT